MGDSYRYDGTFTGLLSLLAQCLPRQIKPETIGIEPPAQQGLFGSVITIATDEEQAAAFWAELARRLPTVGCRHLQTVFLADHPQRELLIYRYCLLAWREGAKAVDRLSHPDVAPLWKLPQQVGREAADDIGNLQRGRILGSLRPAVLADRAVLHLPTVGLTPGITCTATFDAATSRRLHLAPAPTRVRFMPLFDGASAPGRSSRLPIRQRALEPPTCKGSGDPRKSQESVHRPLERKQVVGRWIHHHVGHGDQWEQGHG